MCASSFELGNNLSDRFGVYNKDFSTWVRAVLKRHSTHAIVLCGSRAKNTFVEHSDLDVWVVASNLDPNFLRRHENATLLRIHNKAPIEALFYTPEETDPFLTQFQVGILDALEFGLCLWHDGYWQTLTARFLNLKQKGLQRGHHAWYTPIL